MATTLPSGQISLADLQNAYGGTSPIGINEYYRGGSYVSSSLGSTNIPTSGTISMANFRGTTAWSLQNALLGDTVTGLIYGSHYNSGGGSAGTLNRVLTRDGYGNLYPIGASGFYFANTGSLGSAGSNPGVQVSSGGLNSVWFPLVPSLHGYSGGYLGRSVLSLGTCDISSGSNPLPDQDTTFCWRHPNTTWSNAMISDLLRFNSNQLSKVQYATRVWWNKMGAGMDSYVGTGFMIFNSNTYNSSGAQACYNARQQFYFTAQNDNGGEWSKQGFTYSPTVSGSGTNLSLTNTGVGLSPYYDNYGNIVGYNTTWQSGSWDFSVFRASEYFLGINGEQNNNLRSDYTYTIGTNDLVIPMMYNNTGFSGGAWNYNRDPLIARFGMFQAY